MLQIISIPLGWIMSSIHDLVGNYGVTLILFTLVTKLLLLPLSIKQKKSTIRMNAFQPLIQNIQKKYANDPAKQNEELARLQHEHGFSMTAGCLPLLIQMPVLFGLIDVIYKPLRYIIGVPAALIGDLKAPGVLWTTAEGLLGSLAKNTPQIDIIKAIAQNPAAFSGILEADVIAKVQSFDFTFLGLDLTATPSLKVFNALLLIPVLSVGFMILQQIITMKFSGAASNDQAAKQQKSMIVMSSVMFTYFSFVIPAGVSLYWVFSSIFGILQEVVLHRFINPEKEKAKIEAEIEAARKARKEQEKKRREKQKTVKGDKYVEEYASEDEAEKARKRLERARALDKEKYGE